MDHSATIAAQPPAATKRRLIMRLSLLAVLLAGMWLAAEGTGMRDVMSAEGLRVMMADAGAFGVGSYLVAFSAGQLAQLPGLAFVLAARVAYGPLVGFLVGYVGALLAVSVSFVVVRAVGGKALSEIKWPWARKILARLDDRPIVTIVILRTLFMLSPPLNYALAMSATRFRDYFVGSAIGLLAPLAVWAFLSGCVLSALAAF
jgi:uncharacterized membrane protein YdjX (TVP38/TMEM64 family)